MARNKNWSVTPILGNDQPFFKGRGDSRFSLCRSLPEWPKSPLKKTVVCRSNGPSPTRFFSRELRRRVPTSFFLVVYSSRGTLPTKKW